MESIQKFICIEAILFPVAGVISLIISDFTVEKYRTLLPLMGVSGR